MAEKRHNNEFEMKIEELAATIREVLTPLITSEYVLLDCPYHSNVGDILIWSGEQAFLETLPYKCLGESSYITFRENMKITPQATILLHGGGNFGDIWRVHSEFRLKIVEKYPNNQIVVFPQTVHYQDKELMACDARIFAEHSNLTICARDKVSYQILKDNFQNHIVMVPDMAFHTDASWLRWLRKGEGERSLYLQRIDRELLDTHMKQDWVSGDIDVRDWPIFERRDLETTLFMALLRLIELTKKSKLTRCFSDLISQVADRYARWYMKHAIKSGVEFISRYRYVYTTRLHVGILAILLNKSCTFVDNSYGKNSAFYDTWLADMNEVKMSR